jgi:D-alanine-D-alanine ligase
MSQPAVLFGGPSPEHDVSILTGLQATRALSSGRPVTAIYWSKAGDFFQVDPALEAEAFVDGVPKGSEQLRLVAGAAKDGGFVPAKTGRLRRDAPLDIDTVLNCCHGGPGEDGSLQAALDLAGLAYTGPTAAGAALGMDKFAFGAGAAAVGLPTLPRWLLDTTTQTGADRRPGQPGQPGPYIVKPRFGGSSIGIEVVTDWDTATALAKSGIHFRRGAVVEPYRPSSYDLNIAVRTWPELQLSAIERPLRSKGEGDILGYKDKYLGGEGLVSAARQLPAQISDTLEKSLRDAAISVAALALARGVARIDFLVDGNDWFVNEINTIPGSLAKYLWVEPYAVPFGTLLSDMVDESRQRPTVRYDSSGADGVALRSAGSIASKLA